MIVQIICSHVQAIDWKQLGFVGPTSYGDEDHHNPMIAIILFLFLWEQHMGQLQYS